MKFDKNMIQQLLIVIVGVLAALFGYDVIQGDETVTISMPDVQVEVAPAADQPDAKPDPAPEAPASDEVEGDE
jgi:hypothetical protein